jgi:hypothetical protein
MGSESHHQSADAERRRDGVHRTGNRIRTRGQRGSKTRRTIHDHVIGYTTRQYGAMRRAFLPDALRALGRTEAKEM